MNIPALLTRMSRPAELLLDVLRQSLDAGRVGHLQRVGRDVQPFAAERGRRRFALVGIATGEDDLRSPCANCLQASRPSPRLPPVTTATFPFAHSFASAMVLFP